MVLPGLRTAQPCYLNYTTCLEKVETVKDILRLIRAALGAVVTVFIVGCGYGGAPTSSPFAIASGRVSVLEKGSNSTLLSSRRQDARAN